MDALGPCREYQGKRNQDGYGRRKIGGRQSTVHRWVMEQVIGRELRADEFVLHRCDNPPCFLFDHLWIGTHAENMQDRQNKGRQARGERHGSRTCPEKFTNPGPRNWAKGDRLPHSKLTADDVREIRRLIADGQTKAATARQFGVSRVAINQIAYGQTYRWVE